MFPLYFSFFFILALKNNLCKENLKFITIKIGKPISYTLDEDEIVRQWAKQICEFTGFENRVEQKEMVNV